MKSSTRDRSVIDVNKVIKKHREIMHNLLATHALSRAAQVFYRYGPHLREKSYCGPHAFLPRLNSK